MATPSKVKTVKAKPAKDSKQSAARPVKKRKEKTQSILPWVIAAMVITAICFWPMLKNQFTDWDDEYYVIKNALLRGPDWAGIFTQAVVSNYHPLTVSTLAINYQLTGLDPSSYLWFNLLLHVLNTGIVFYFAWLISGKKLWVGFLVALIFGLHPLHVESVAWISERKDVLYTFFFLLSLIQYWHYLQTNKSGKLWLSFLFFILSILSKPAAIILPLVLLLLDYWKGRPLSQKLFTEKILFFLVAILFGVITVKIQSVKAIAGLDLYPLWTRPIFACYVVMIYFLRFFVPYPLSAFHPYPEPDHLGWTVLISPLFILAAVAFLWWQRKNRLLIFGAAFFIINLLLVMQIVSIGTTIVSERYTYVPYIGLGFVLGMLLYQLKSPRPALMGTAVVVTLVFGWLSFQRTQVWRDSGTLWTDALSHYPNASLPRTNRANFTLNLSFDPANAAKKDSLYQNAMDDCNIALKANPNHAPGYQNREFIYLNEHKLNEAIADATMYVKLDPSASLGYATRGVAYMQLNEFDKALTDLNKSLELDPNGEFALDNRGSLLYNHYQRYSEAAADFSRAIEISPKANFYLNRSFCYYQLGDLAKAKADAQIALQKGAAINENYKKQINL
jgi:Tfp pilus assembly protein PilF